MMMQSVQLSLLLLNLEGKQLRENNANSKGKVEAVTAADAGVEEAATV